MDEMEMKGLLWVLLDGMDEPQAIGVGIARVEASDLVLRGDGRAVIGRFGLSNVRDWRVQRLNPPTAEWMREDD